MENSDFVSDVLIIGAGISGLSLAHFLSNQGLEITILEKTQRSGGIIESQIIDGFRIDQGPQTILLEPEVKKLLKDLGLEDQIIFPPQNETARHLAYRKNKKIFKAPSSIYSLLTSGFFNLNEFATLIKELLKKHPVHHCDDLSLGELFEKRFGKKFTTSTISAPFIGVWASSIYKLSAREVMPEVFKAYLLGESIIKRLISNSKTKIKHERAKIFSLKNGLESLTSRIENSLKSPIHKNVEIIKIENSNDQWEIKTTAGMFYTKELVISTSGTAFTKLVEKLQIPALADNDALLNLLTNLQTIKYSSVGMMHLAFPTLSTREKLTGFGTLVPLDKCKGLLGMIYTSALFPHKAKPNMTYITCFSGGTIIPDLADVLDKTIEIKIISEIKELLNLGELEVTVLEKNYWQSAIPLYSPGHFKLNQIIKELKTLIPNLNIHSNITNGVGVPARIKASLILASEILYRLKKPNSSPKNS